MWQIILAFGIPTAMTGLFIWWLKKHIDKTEKKREEREKNRDQFMLYIMKTSLATHVLAEATAKAVQRIPDAHCNGDMTSALEKAMNIQNEEKEFLMDHGIRHIFE